MEAMHHLNRKAVKEAFVAGLVGSSKLEVFAIVATLSLSIVICEAAKLRRPAGVGLLLEMLLIVYPQLLLCTLALPLWPTCVCSLLLASACSLWVVARAGPVLGKDAPAVEDLAGRRKSFVSAFRGALMAATCTCILAVDFRTFPRRYAKTEAYGTGYMDVGVGGVVLTAGLVSAAGLPYKSSGAGGGAAAGAACWRPEPLGRRLYGGLRGAAACWLLGLVRLVTTRAVDYQAHVGEYGVHWNFFDTVAVVALLGQAVALPPEALAPAALAVTAVHQVVLSLGGLGPWVMSPHRGTDLLSLNKEGLVSCVGFWAIYLWGAALAHSMHATLQPAVRHLRAAATSVGPAAAAAVAAGGAGWCSGAAAAGPLVRWWLQLAALDGVLWVAVVVLEARVERISRRSCNAAYILWVTAQCLAGMLPLALWQALTTAAAAGRAPGGGSGGSGSSGYAATRLTGMTAPAWGERGAGGGGGRSDVGTAASTSHHAPSPPSAGAATAVVATGGQSGPRILQAINRNQLAVFLAANLLTGAVNLSVDTMQVSDWPARALLGAYMTCVCGLALLLDLRGWRIKL